jgi:hypothetical protein
MINYYPIKLKSLANHISNALANQPNQVHDW